MDIVEHYAKLTDAISRLEHQASSLRQDMLPFAHLRYAQYHGDVRYLADIADKPERLLPEIVNDPQFRDIALNAKENEHPVAVCPAFLRPDRKSQVDVLRYRC